MNNRFSISAVNLERIGQLQEISLLQRRLYQLCGSDNIAESQQPPQSEQSDNPDVLRDIQRSLGLINLPSDHLYNVNTRKQVTLHLQQVLDKILSPPIHPEKPEQLKLMLEQLDQAQLGRICQEVIFCNEAKINDVLEEIGDALTNLDGPLQKLEGLQKLHSGLQAGLSEPQARQQLIYVIEQYQLCELQSQYTNLRVQYEKLYENPDDICLRKVFTLHADMMKAQLALLDENLS